MTIKIKTYLGVIALSATITACGGGTPAGTTDEAIDQASASVPGTTNESAPAVGAAVASLEDTAAHRFLTRATFGPTLEDMESFIQQSPADWINDQMALPPTYMSQGLADANSRWAQYVNVWWETTIEAPDQLRQRVAFALSEILVISGIDSLGDEQPGLANYYDILVDHAFGNYRDLMEAITLNPMMGEYLSMKGNRKPDVASNIRPDENFARELLQLFTIGLEQLNQDGSVQRDGNGIALPTYDQNTVEAFAHVFTGWHFANADDFRWASTKDYLSPMRAFEDFHDKGSKELLNGFVVPANQSAAEDLTMALDNIFNHPNVGPFLSKQLIKRLVTSNPSPQYISDVAAVFNDNGNGTRGSLASVVSAILLHDEALNGYELAPNTFGKLKEPVLRISALWRAFKPDNIHRDFNYSFAAGELNQAPLNANSVFNFFTPFFSQPGAIRSNNLVSPEFEIHDETSIITITNRLLANSLWAHNAKYESDEQRIAININRELEFGDDLNALLDHLDKVLLGGTMSNELRQEALRLMNSRDYSWAASQRIVEAIFLIATSPEAAVQL